MHQLETRGFFGQWFFPEHVVSIGLLPRIEAAMLWRLKIWGQTKPPMSWGQKTSNFQKILLWKRQPIHIYEVWLLEQPCMIWLASFLYRLLQFISVFLIKQNKCDCFLMNSKDNYFSSILLFSLVGFWLSSFNFLPHYVSINEIFQ